MNRRYAEAWENDFSEWEIQDRTIQLTKREIGYRVSLGDGVAYFRSETAEAYAEARRHAGQLVEGLARERKQKALATIEAQHLLPVDESFESLVSRLSERLLTTPLLTALNARLFDFAYLVDTRIDGRYYQFSIGPLKQNEIPSRVAARDLKVLPKVALFCGIATRKSFDYEPDDLSDYVSKTLDIGTKLLRELMP
jgi:hypothetical protein